MSSACQNPERWVETTRRLLPIILVTLLAVGSRNASAQQDTPPYANGGPQSIFVTDLLPNGDAPPPPDPIGAQFEGNKPAIAAGEALFGEMNCTGCHFNGGGGMGPPLMSSDWRYGGRMDQIYASIAQGRPNGMPSWQLLLQPTMIWELAAYIKSLPIAASQTDLSGTRVKR
jgi:cytochrome c oxidase cbb3-type subunit 3